MKLENTDDISITSSLIGAEVLPYLVPLLIILTALFGIHHFSGVDSKVAATQQHESEVIRLSSGVIDSRTENLLPDVSYLARVTERLLSDAAADTADSDHTLLRRAFLEFSNGHQSFSQIRILDVSGEEILRANRQPDTTLLVPNEELQNKSSRYYFGSLQNLTGGEFYVSPLDLNVEHGKVQEPRQPTIRIGTSLYDTSGERTGWLLVNISASYMLREFRESAGSAMGRLMLLNSDGYYLASPNEEDNWSFMFDGRRSFVSSHPELWAILGATASGQLYSDLGLISYTTLLPFHDSGRHRWKVVLVSPDTSIAGAHWTELKANLPFYLLMLGLCVAATVVIGFHRLHLYQTRIQREYARNYQNILQDIGLLAVSLDADSRISYCNDHFLEKVGLESNGVVGHSFSDFLPADDGQMSSKLKIMFADHESETQFRGPLSTAKNQELTIDWSATLTLDSPVHAARLTLIGKDITEQMAAEEERRTLSRAVEQSASIVMITDAEARIQYVNPKFTQLTGYSAGEVRGKNPRLLQSGETTRSEYEQIWDTILRTGQWRGEFRNRKKNGELYWEFTTISEIRNSEGETTHYLSVKEDLTEQKRLEAEAKQHEKEIAQNRELAIVGRIANMIAHDLRNPLSSVKMSLQILGKGQYETQEKEELVTISLDQVRYMENMITDLLSYSRQSDLNPEWLSIDKLLDNAISVTQRAIASHGVRVETDYQTGLPTVFGDRTRLTQLFSNLVLNAVQATEKNHRDERLVIIRATLLLSSGGTSIAVEIADNGEGIDDESTTRIFEPFFTTRAKGTGLGLAIVQRVVAQHGGSVEMAPCSSGGTRATVTLPTTALSDEKVELRTAP